MLEEQNLKNTLKAGEGGATISLRSYKFLKRLSFSLATVNTMTFAMLQPQCSLPAYLSLPPATELHQLALLVP